MTEASFSSLKKAAQQVSTSQTPMEKISALSKAFELFSLETIRLENSYNSLKEEYQAQNVELEAANKALLEKVAELDFISHYLEIVMNSITQGILFIDLNGTVTTYNSSAAKILNVPEDTAVLQPYWDNFDDCLFGFSVKEALSNRKAPSAVTTRVFAETANAKDLEITISFVLGKREPIDARADENENIAVQAVEGLIVLIRDVTEMKRLQTLAERNDRMKELGEMAAMVAHEIRNPLGGIKGFASLLIRDLKDNPEMAQMARYIVEGTETLNRLVTNVLNYARPVQPHFEPTDIGQLIKSVQQHIEADEEMGKMAAIETGIDEELEPISADSQLLGAAILNLVVNGIQAMPNGGKIIISATRKDGYVYIQVRDTGLGIPKENMEKIFRPFFTTKSSGNGFGLSEVYKIVSAHGGLVEVDSEEGKGSAFTIKLPDRV